MAYARRAELRATYDFAVDGGAIGSHTLVKGLSVPSNAVIVETQTSVLTPLTSAGAATVALGLNTAGDVTGATAFGSFAGAQDYTNTPFCKTTATRNLKFDIAGAALTAGKMDIFLAYVQ